MTCCMSYPRCEFHHCGEPAAGSAMVPMTWKLPLRLGPKFFCVNCWATYCEDWKKPLKGITPPENASEDWKGSIMEHVRFAEIAIAFEERDQPKSVPAPDVVVKAWEIKQRGWTPAQVEQVRTMRHLFRKYGAGK